MTSFQHSEVVLDPIDPRFRVGFHVGLQATLHESLRQPIAREANCVQLFLGNNRSYECRTLSSHDRTCVKNHLAFMNRRCYVHCNYLANLATDDPVKLGKSRRVVEKLLQQMEGLGSCVLHIGKVGPLENVIRNLNEISIPSGQGFRPLLMENAAGQGTELGATWDQLRKMYEGLDTTRIGLCLDTQHMFAAGMCDFRDSEAVEKMFDRAEEVCPGGVDMIHLNDSRKPFGSRVDRHENLGRGYIWSQSFESLDALMSHSNERSTDLVLETPNPVNDWAWLKQRYAS